MMHQQAKFIYDSQCSSLLDFCEMCSYFPPIYDLYSYIFLYWALKNLYFTIKTQNPLNSRVFQLIKDWLTKIGKSPVSGV